MFENERYQPFRGWGHQWPGHFLPTDRVGHWSTQASAQQANLDSASFDAIAPKLKQARANPAALRPGRRPSMFQYLLQSYHAHTDVRLQARMTASSMSSEVSVIFDDNF